MEQRRKIIVPTGVEADETLTTPHFDAEATLLARPVVPLPEPVEPPPDVYTPAHAAAQANGASSAPSLWKRSTLIMIILAAVCVGIASGLAIGLYQSRQKAPVAASTTTTTAPAQPVVSEPQQAEAQPQAEARQSARVEQPAEEETEEDASADDEETRGKEPKRRSDDDARDDDDDKPVARDNRKRDEERAAPPVVVRERPVEIPDIDEREEKRRERREQRREERREARRRQREENADGPVEFPRNVERARQEINRIRDIFEGRQP